MIRLRHGIYARTHAGTTDVSGAAVVVLLSNKDHCWVEVVGRLGPLAGSRDPNAQPLLLLVPSNDLER